MNSEQILKTIADNILKKLSDNQRLGTDVNVIIYMDNEFYQELMAGVHRSGFMSNLSWDFSEKYTIMGYQVFSVIPQYTREGTVRHPNYEVVIL